MGRLDDAEQFYGRALGNFERTLGPRHPKVATCLSNYAALLRAMNRVPQARVLERRAEPIRE